MDRQEIDEITKIIKTPKMKSFQEDEDKLILQPFDHIQNKTPVSQISIKLCHAYNYWLKIPSDKFHVVCEIVKLTQAAVLLMDDIEDNATHRNGVPVANSIYGIGLTLNTASLLFYLALEKARLLNNHEVIRILNEQMLELHRGQGIEIYWKDNFQIPTELEYKMMAARKTGGLFHLIPRLLQLFGANTRDMDFSRLSTLMALRFQIWNDQSDMIVSPDNENFCKDLTEGYFNFVIVSAIHNETMKEETLRLLKQKTVDIEAKKSFIRLLKENGILHYTRKTLIKLEEGILGEISKFGKNPLFDSVLNEIPFSRETSEF